MSKFLSLNLQDVIKGAVVTALTAAIAVVGTSINAGRMPTVVEWKISGVAAAAAAVSYLVKNLLTNSKGELVKAEPKQPTA